MYHHMVNKALCGAAQLCDINRLYTGHCSDMGARFADWFYELDDIRHIYPLPRSGISLIFGFCAPG